MHNLQNMHIKIRNECIKSNDHERNITQRQRVSGVQSDETESKGVKWCPFTSVYFKTVL